MKRYIYVLALLATTRIIGLSNCERARNDNFGANGGDGGAPALPAAAPSAGDSQDQWDYARHGSDWTHGMCSAGFRQSPVDLHVEGLNDRPSTNLDAVYRAAMRNEIPDLSYNPWRRGDVVYTYNRYLSTVQVLRTPNVFRLTLPPNEGSTFGALFTTDKPNLYVATHIDFHSPSEHTFDGSANRRQIEMQIWHYLNDAPSSDLGISSMDVPETTEVNMVITPAAKRAAEAAKLAASGKQAALKPAGQAAAGLKAGPQPGPAAPAAQSGGAQPGAKKAEAPGGSGSANASKDGWNLKLNVPFFGDDDHEADDADEGNPSMVQLSANLVSSDRPHPLGSDTSDSVRATLDKDRFDLFKKYLLSHLEKAGKKVDAERLHVREKAGARQKNSHWGRWAVISLTFMSEEIEKTNIEKLREYSSERFMAQVFKAGSSVGVSESAVYAAVGDLNTPHADEPLPVVDLETPLNLSSLFMMLETRNLTYFAYDGSFTQPGCEETVRWYVAKESIPISTELMLQLHRMLNPNPHVSNPNNYVDNFRELQNVNQKRRNTGNVRFVHGYPLEYFVISPFSQEPAVSGFAPAGAAFALSLGLAAAVALVL